MLELEYHSQMPRKKSLYSFSWANCSLSTHLIRSCQDKIKVVILHTSVYPISKATFDINRKFFSRKGTNMWRHNAVMLFSAHIHTHTLLFICKEKMDSLCGEYIYVSPFTVWRIYIRKSIRNLRSNNDITFVNVT